MDLNHLPTESPDPGSYGMHQHPTIEILRLINAEDAKVPEAVEQELESIGRVVDLVADRLGKGGRLFYVGAGTSGRLGVLDASECPPTFGVEPETVQGIIAGGEPALVSAAEGAEDDPEASGEERARRRRGAGMLRPYAAVQCRKGAIRGLRQAPIRTWGRTQTQGDVPATNPHRPAHTRSRNCRAAGAARGGGHCHGQARQYAAEVVARLPRPRQI